MAAVFKNNEVKPQETSDADDVKVAEFPEEDAAIGDKKHLVVKVSRDKLGLLLGRKRTNLRRIENTFDVDVWVKRWVDETGTFAEVAVAGKPDACARAVGFIKELVRPVEVEFKIHRRNVGMVIGPSGSVSRAVCSMYGVRLVIDDWSNEMSSSAKVKVMGPRSSCQAAEIGIKSLIEENSKF